VNRMKFFGRITLIVSLSIPLVAADDDRYFFYKATKADVTLYLLGSMHVGKPNDPDYPAKIYEALEESGALVLEGEVRPEKIRQPDMAVLRMRGSKKLTELLSKKEKGQLEKICEKLGVPMYQFEQYEPWFVEFMFGYRMAFNEGFVLEYGTEHSLIRRINKKPMVKRQHIFALEGNDEVLRAMHALPLDDQLGRFRDFLNYSEKTGAGTAVEMQKVWRSGDEAALQQIFNYYAATRSAATERYLQVLLFDRNRRMAHRLNLVALYPGKYFVVTGALHLVGPQNILTYLEKSGFTIERQ